MQRKPTLAKVGLAAGGLVAGVVLASTLSASADSSTPSPTAPSGSTTTATTEDPHPGDKGADGVPEAQEHHDGRPGGDHGHGLDLSGKVTAVDTSSVTIATSTGTTKYAVTASSDIDKNGESTLAALAVGDAVTFSVDGTTIDKLHAGDEAKNMPAHDGNGGPDSDAPATSGTTASPNA